MHPALRLLRSARGNRATILMYHEIGEGTTTHGHPYYALHTSPQRFAMQMRILREDGYDVLDLAAVAERLGSGKRLHGKTVVITFDDGLRSFYTHAFPILRECRFPATVFLVSDLMAGPRQSLLGHECLTWPEARELQQSGMVAFGSHTCTHPLLAAAPWQAVERELLDSKEAIETALQRSVTAFSYPYAFPENGAAWHNDLRARLVAARYTTGVTTMIGRARPGTDPLFLPRLPVNAWDDARLFRAKLAGAYDWLRSLQRLRKHLKRGPRTNGRAARSTPGESHA